MHRHLRYVPSPSIKIEGIGSDGLTVEVAAFSKREIPYRLAASATNASRCATTMSAAGTSRYLVRPNNPSQSGPCGLRVRLGGK
jgi:hypothetical protein